MSIFKGSEYINTHPLCISLSWQ